MSRPKIQNALLLLISVISAAVNAATWNLADNFSNIGNPSGEWSYGVIGGPNNASGYAIHPGASSYAGFDYWWTNTPGQDNTARGFLIHNPSLSTCLNLTGSTSVWGDSFVLRPNEAALTSSVYNIPDKQAFRWTAPADGSYDIEATFSGISYAGTGTNCNVYIQLNSTVIFQNEIHGFVGSDEFFMPAFGTKPTAVYTDTLTLSAGDAIYFLKNNTATATGNSVGVDIRIFKAPEYPGIEVSLPLYVAPDGSDDNNGTIDHPLATIERARNIVAWLIYDGLTENVQVYLRQGNYYLNQPLVFTESDGDSTYTITYEAYPGENPVISGGREITGWAAIGNDKYTVTLPDVADGASWFRQLWKDGQRQQRSRWPNAGQTLVISNASSDFFTITLEQSIPASDFANNDGELVVYHNWSTSRQKIVSSTVDSITTLYPAGSIGHETLEPAAGDLAHLEHHPDFIDLPGEWHLNRTTGILTYKASPGTNPNDSVFIAPKLEKLIEMRGTMSAPINNLIFKGLCFKHAGWNLPAIGYAGIQACHYGTIPFSPPTYIVPAAIELYYAKNCQIENCLIKNIGSCAVAFGMSTEQCKIIGSEITDIGANGIMNGYRGSTSDNRILQGTGSLDTDWLEPAIQAPKNTTISNNFIHKTAAELFGGVAIWSAFSKDTQITNNIVTDTPYTGISIGFRWHPIPHSQQATYVYANHIHNVMKTLNDGGGIYTLGDQRSCVLSKNLIHDVHVGWYLSWLNNAIFFDNATSNITCSETCTYNIHGEYQTDYRYNQSEAGVTQLVNYWDKTPADWGAAEIAIADAAGTQTQAPVLSVLLDRTKDSYSMTASCQAWANIENAVIVETGLDITNLVPIKENGQISATIPASLLNTTSTATIKLTISDPDGDTATGVWSMRNSWDVADDFSGTDGNPNAQWSYGYKDSTGIFTLLPDFGGHYYMNMSGWFINNSWQAVCMVNEDAQPREPEFWGSNYYAQPNSTYLAQTNLSGQNVVYRWTAPADGIYYLETEFAGAIYSGGETNSNVSVVVNNTTVAFSDFVQGFEGGGTHTSGGVKPTASCEGALELAAGNTVDFIQSDRNSSGNDITRLSATITLLGSVESYNKGDLNFDGIVNNHDLYTLVMHWLEAYNPTYNLRPLGDVTNDKIVNLNDFAVIAAEWLK